MTVISTDPPLLLLAAAATSFVAVGRFTRLVVYDKYPPSMWLRERYTKAVPERWAGLASCPFCLAPWAQLASLMWAWLGGLNPETWSGGLWWLTHLWFALSYLAAMLVVRDQPIVYEDDEPPGS